MNQPENSEGGKVITEGDQVKRSNIEMVRQRFRIPVNESDAITLICADRRYGVSNLSNNGLAVYLPEGEKFCSPGEILGPVHLEFEDQTITLTVKVISFYVDEHGKQECGLSFVDLSDIATRRIDEIYWHLRKQLFSAE